VDRPGDGASRMEQDLDLAEQARTRGAFPASRAGGAQAGAAVGVLMLDTAFPRPVGDIGNPETFRFPVIYERVRGASAQRVVRERAEGLLQPFVQGGLRLVERGAAAIATSCGFLVLFQRELARALPVPVAASSLLQVAWVEPLLPKGRRCGVITFDASALSAEHLRAAGARPDTPVAGMPAGGALQRAVLDDASEMDVEAVRAEAIEVAGQLLRSAPEIGALVLECTNLPPYADDLRARYGLPVFDSTTLLEWLWQGVRNGIRE